MVNSARTLIVCTRIGNRYWTTYLNDLDRETGPYVCLIGLEVGSIPVGLEIADLPEDGQTRVKICRWNG